MFTEDELALLDEIEDAAAVIATAVRKIRQVRKQRGEAEVTLDDPNNDPEPPRPNGGGNAKRPEFTVNGLYRFYKENPDRFAKCSTTQDHVYAMIDQNPGLESVRGINGIIADVLFQLKVSNNISPGSVASMRSRRPPGTRK